jgi:hypothetical protein
MGNSYEMKVPEKPDRWRKGTAALSTMPAASSRHVQGHENPE